MLCSFLPHQVDALAAVQLAIPNLDHLEPEHHLHALRPAQQAGPSMAAVRQVSGRPVQQLAHCPLMRCIPALAWQLKTLTSLARRSSWLCPIAEAI